MKISTIATCSFLLGLFSLSTLPGTKAADIEQEPRFYLPNHPYIPPSEGDVRSPCPFVNTMANHGFIPRNGKGADLVQMIIDMENIFSLARDFTFVVGNNTVNCNQTFTDEDGVIRLDIDRLFDAECEEHESSLVRQDAFFGFEESKLVDDTLLNNLMRVNPTSEEFTLEDVFTYQTERVIDSVMNNPEAVYGEFDILNSAAQAITLFMLGDDPELRTVPKSRVYSLLLLERIPDDLVPGAIREKPFNFLDSSDPAAAIFNDFVNNINQTRMMDFGQSGKQSPFGPFFDPTGPSTNLRGGGIRGSTNGFSNRGGN